MEDLGPDLAHAGAHSARAPRSGVGLGLVLASSAFAATLGAGIGAVAPRFAEVDQALDRIAPDQTNSVVAALKADLATLEAAAAKSDELAALDNRFANLESSINTPLAQAAGAEQPGAITARLIGLQSDMKTIEGRLASAATQDDLAAVRKDVTALQASFGKVAEDAARAIRAAAASYAVTAATDAARTAGPFDQSYATLAALLPNDANVRALGPYARVGAPTPGELKDRFRSLETELTRAARIAEAGDGTWGKINAWFAQYVVVRRVDAGVSPADAVARASRRIAADDLAGAVNELRQLGGAAGDLAQPWIRQAEARLTIDTAIAGIRADLAKGS